ncbi:hypothetical protein D9M68_754270 [compost metagenome]
MQRAAEADIEGGAIAPDHNCMPPSTASDCSEMCDAFVDRRKVTASAISSELPMTDAPQGKGAAILLHLFQAQLVIDHTLTESGIDPARPHAIGANTISPSSLAPTA